MKEAAKAAMAVLIGAAVIFGAMQVRAEPIATDTMYVKSHEGLNVREKPTTDSRSLAILPFGAEVEVVDGDEEWQRILYGNGIAYVATDWISYNDPIELMIHLGEWRVTAYAYTGSPCANGQFPTEGYTIACNSLPFGTEVYIEGVGFRTVEDRGPEWLGDNWCDLYLGSEDACWQWGNQYLDVYVVNAEEYGDD